MCTIDVFRDNYYYPRDVQNACCDVRARACECVVDDVLEESTSADRLNATGKRAGVCRESMADFYGGRRHRALRGRARGCAAGAGRRRSGVSRALTANAGDESSPWTPHPLAHCPLPPSPSTYRGYSRSVVVEEVVVMVTSHARVLIRGIQKSPKQEQRKYRLKKVQTTRYDFS